MTVSREKLTKLSQWNVDQRVLEALKGTGFDHLYRLAQNLGRCHHDNHMLGALVKYYHVGDMCFKVNNRNLFFGLEDVLYISGLRVEGRLVIKGEEEVNGNPLVVGLGGVPAIHLKNNAVRLDWLRDRFETVPEVVDDETFDRHVRAFSLYVLGTTILSNKDHRFVNLCYLKCLSVIGEIKEYAWGVAMLSHVHHSLRHHCNTRSSAIGSHLFFLMVWALEHIPAFARELFKPDDPVYPSEFPLSCSWGLLLPNVLSNRHKEKNYKHHLDHLWEDENRVTWQPYTRLSENFLPEEIRSQRRMGRFRGILIHPFHRQPLIFHRPDLCPSKLGFREADVTHCLPMLEDRKRFRNWQHHVREWEKLEHCFVMNPDEQDGDPSVQANSALQPDEQEGEPSVQGNLREGRPQRFCQRKRRRVNEPVLQQLYGSDEQAGSSVQANSSEGRTQSLDYTPPALPPPSQTPSPSSPAPSSSSSIITRIFKYFLK